MTREQSQGGQAVSDTPRTDAAYAASTGAGIYELFKESQDIERELNAANEKAQRYHEHILKHKAENEHLTNKIHQLREGAEEQKQTIKELEEVNEYLREKCLTLEYGRTSK